MNSNEMLLCRCGAQMFVCERMCIHALLRVSASVKLDSFFSVKHKLALTHKRTFANTQKQHRMTRKGIRLIFLNQGGEIIVSV